MDLKAALAAYTPFDEREAADKAMMLRCLAVFDDVLTRENPICHFTASNWIVNPDRTKVLMAWHNIYRSWAWTGGHADGESDLMAVARREALEETGAADLKPLVPGIFAIEAVCVDSHVKRGRVVSSHLHLDCCYLWQAREDQDLRGKPDENSGVAWIPMDQIERFSTEPEMWPIYRKLNAKLAAMQS